MVVEIKEGKVFIDGVPTTDPTYIGCAILDLAEKTETSERSIHLTVEDFVEQE